MKLEDLVDEYQRRRQEATEHGASAPLAKVYAVVLDELRQIDDVPKARFMTAHDAAPVLGLHPRTVGRWCKRGKLPGAIKTSEKGEWRIPSNSVYAQLDGTTTTGRHRLWEAS